MWQRLSNSTPPKGLEMIDKILIERLVRKELVKLGPNQTLSTADLGNRICDEMGTPAHERQFRSAVFAHLDKLGEHARDLCDLVPDIGRSGHNKGKPIKAKRWKHIDSPEIPGRPTPIAAPIGSSLVTRVADLEAEVAKLKGLVALLAIPTVDDLI